LDNNFLTISKFIKSLEQTKTECGDLPISMFNQRQGTFEGFSSMVLPAGDADQDFLGLVSKGDVKSFLELATTPETAEQ
jgi:hypothetical protein